MQDVVRLQRLIEEYGGLRRLQDHTAQSRGRRFNEVIAELLRCWGIDAQVSLRSAGEIDVAFAAGGVRYVLEAKWEKAKTDTGHVAKLQKRVRQRLAGTYGVFLSMSGYSDEAVADVAHGERLEVLLLDAAHFEAMLGGLVPPQEMLSRVHDRASFLGEAYTPLSKLLVSAEDPPVVEFGAPGPIGAQLVRSAAPGLSGEIVCSLPDSRQLGIACLDHDRLLVTTGRGIIEVDLAARHVHWALPVADCHRNPLVDDDGAILFTRRHGVGRVHDGQLSVVGGGLPGSTSLLRHPNGSSWVFSNGDPDGRTSASITKLGSQLGDEVRHDVDYPPASAFNSVWLTDAEVLIIGNPFFTIASLATGETRRHQAAQINPMGVVNLGGGVVLTAGDAVTLGRTDVWRGEYREIAQLSLKPSVNELARSPDGSVYIAAYIQGGADRMPIAIARIVLPSTMPLDAPPSISIRSGKAEADTGDISATDKRSTGRLTVAHPAPRQHQTINPTSDQPPVVPAQIPWDVVRADRGNQEGAYVAFDAHRRLYWVIVALNLLIILVLSIIVAAPETSFAGKVGAGVAAIVVLVLTVGWAMMAKSPVRLEIGAQGIQVFARRETTWIPWDVIERVDVIRVQGHHHIVGLRCVGAKGGGTARLPG
jgi:hypothetical protein